MRKLIIVAVLAIFICSIAPAQIKVVLVQDYEQMKANGTKQLNPTPKKSTVRKAAFNATETTDDEETIASDTRITKQILAKRQLPHPNRQLSKAMR